MLYSGSSSSPLEFSSPAPLSLNNPSVQPPERSRLLPRIGFRTLFALTTMGAILAAIARAAGNGTVVAKGFLISVGFLAVVFAAFAVFFLFAWIVSLLWYRPSEEIYEGSPFAANQLPPQILPPRDRQS